MADSMNMTEVTVEDFLRFIKEQLEDGDLTPILGLGKSGVGKTQSVFEVTQELGIGFKEIRLVTMNETDLLGIPVIERERNQDGTENIVANWASNKLLPIAERDGEVGILVLDEITSATSTIRAASYQLLDSKRALGNYKLPPKWLVVALGNGPDDGGVFQGMEHAFLNRTFAMRVNCDAKTWRKWAVSHEIHPAVVGFISFAPDKLHVFNPDDEAGLFPSPRSWVALSNKLKDRERRNGGKLEESSVYLYAACCVGVDVATSFASFYKFTEQTIDVFDILKGTANLTEIPLMQAQVVHLSAQQLAKELHKLLENDVKSHNGMTTDAGFKYLDNVCKWILALYNVSVDSSQIFFSILKSDVKYVQAYVMDDDLDKKAPNVDRLVDLLLPLNTNN